MGKLEDNFVLGRGDLIYGFEKGRDLYIKNSTKLQAAVLTGSWIIANDFNNNTILSFNQFFTPTGKSTLTEEEQIKEILAKLKQIGKLDEGSPFVKAIYKKYPPAAVQKIDFQELVHSGDSHFFKMVRRSCKFGIQYVTEILDGNAKVHFVLDYMPDERVIIEKHKLSEKGAKDPSGRVPITVSELRFVFRNWSRLQHRIIFYKSLREYFAPWETNPIGWRDYALARYQKYAKLAAKAKCKDLLANVNEHTASSEMLLMVADKIKAGLQLKEETVEKESKEEK